MIMEEIKYEIDNTYIHYVKFGEGPKNLIIVSGISLGGFEGMGSAIARQYDMLATDYTCYVFDRKVYIPDGYTIEDSADDLYSVLNGIGVESADFVGYSQGGMISLSMAVRHPDMVNKLLLGSTSAYANEVSDNVWSQCREYLKKSDTRGFNMFLFERIYSEDFFNKHKAALNRLAKGGTSQQIKRFVRLTNAIDKFDIRDEINKIKCPCFVIGAGKDRIFGPKASYELAEGLNCDLYMYEAQGHSVYDEAPDYCEKILNFLKNS